MSSINFLGVVSVVGVCLIVKYIWDPFSGKNKIHSKEKREYQPTLQDRRLNDGGNVVVANILGLPRVGSV